MAKRRRSWPEPPSCPKKVQPPGFYGRGFTLVALGDALIGLRRYPEAEAALLEAHAIVLRALGPKAEALERPAASLVRLYELTGQEQKAQVWRPRPGS